MATILGTATTIISDPPTLTSTTSGLPTACTAPPFDTVGISATIQAGDSALAPTQVMLTPAPGMTIVAGVNPHAYGSLAPGNTVNPLWRVVIADPIAAGACYDIVARYQRADSSWDSTTLAGHYCLTRPAWTGASPTLTSTRDTLCLGASVTLTEQGSPYDGLHWSTGASGTIAITVAPTVTTAYACTLTYGACRAVTPAKTIVVVQPPAVPTPGPNATICSGEVATLYVQPQAGVTHLWAGPGVAANTHGDTLHTSVAGTFTCRSIVTPCSTATVALTVTVNSTCINVSAAGLGPGGAATWTVTVDSLSAPRVLPSDQSIAVTNLSSFAIDFGMLVYAPPWLREDSLGGGNRFSVQAILNAGGAPPQLGDFVYARDLVPTTGVLFGDATRWTGGGYNVSPTDPNNARQLWLKLVPPRYFSASPFTLHLALSARAHVP